MAVTVDDLRPQARQRADMVNANFVSPSEWVSYIDKSYKELYDQLVVSFEDYYTIMTQFTVASGETSYSLPADFYKLRGVDRAMGGSNFYALRRFVFEDRNRRGYYQRYRGVQPYIAYRLMANSIIFSPEDQAPGDYRMWYVPAATTLTSGADTIDGINGWESYVVVGAAIMALMKEESDISALLLEKQGIEKRIRDMALDRDVGETDRITDVSPGGQAYNFWD